jgi:hypothetical protein
LVLIRVRKRRRSDNTADEAIQRCGKIGEMACQNALRGKQRFSGLFVHNVMPSDVVEGTDLTGINIRQVCSV